MGTRTAERSNTRWEEIIGYNQAIPMVYHPYSWHIGEIYRIGEIFLRNRPYAEYITDIPVYFFILAKVYILY